MAERAALLWHTDVDNVEIGIGIFINKTDTEQRLSFKELASRLEQTGGLISEQATVTPEGVGYQLAAHLVDVDPQRFGSLHRKCHPSTAEVTTTCAQLHGAIGVHHDFSGGRETAA